MASIFGSDPTSEGTPPQRLAYLFTLGRDDKIFRCQLAPDLEAALKLPTGRGRGFSRLEALLTHVGKASVDA